MPIDFLADEYENQKRPSSVRDFLQEDLKKEPKESFGTAAGLAIPRVLEDLGKRIYGGIQNIPSYYQAAKTEVPGMINAFRNDPFHAMGQEYAGFAEQGKNIFNTPHDVVNYLSERLHLVPENINKIVQMGRMPDKETEEAINATFGKPTQAGENLLRGLNRNILSEMALGSLGGNVAKNIYSLKNAFNRPNPESAIKSILNAHDTLENMAISGFDKVGKEAIKRNVNTIPIRKDLISEIEGLLPKTKRTQNLLNKASTGDYQSLRDLQSDLFHRSNSALNSPLQSDRYAGEMMKDLRSEIIDSTRNHFKNTGNIDLANDLDKARNQYRKLREIYYGNKTPRAIQNLVNPNLRKMPKNILEVLSESSIPMGKIKKEIPYLEKISNKYQSKQNAINTLKKLSKISVGTAGIGTTILEAPYLYKYFTGKEKNENKE